MQYDVAIIGAGPVGIFAAFQAGVLGMNSCVIDSLNSIGGQCTELYPEKYIYDIPGYPKITASSLIKNLEQQAAVFKPNYILGQVVTDIEKKDERFILTTNLNKKINCKAVIVAAGSGAFCYNKLPIESAAKFENKSLFYSVKQVEKFRNKDIVIAGGGDSAADWAVMLCDVAKSVYLVHRRSKFRCAQVTMAKILQLQTQGKINVMTPYFIHDIKGDDQQITGIVLQQVGGATTSLKADFILAFFGLKADLANAKNWGLKITNQKIEVDPVNYQTNVSGIYAVGDVAAYPQKLKLILCGFAEVAMVCHHILRNKFSDRVYNFQYSTNMQDIFA